MNYNKLWKKLIDKNMKKTDLIELCGISSATLAKMSNNQNVSMETIIRICEKLDCDIGDIVEINKN